MKYTKKSSQDNPILGRHPALYVKAGTLSSQAAQLSLWFLGRMEAKFFHLRQVESYSSSDVLVVLELSLPASLQCLFSQAHTMCGWDSLAKLF